MACVEEKIRLETDGTLSFGNYSVSEKQKLDGFEVNGDLYKVKTHNEVTRLEKNSKLLLESVPGSTVHNFKLTEKVISYDIEGYEDTRLTLELEPKTEYRILIDDVNVGKMKSNLSGKINFSIDLSSRPQNVKIEKIP
ncbi:MAG: endosialidase [Clostridiales bacterium]|jgi:hypothetical protein|nr:endosialidase [Clostridiales bacterium]